MKFVLVYTDPSLEPRREGLGVNLISKLIVMSALTHHWSPGTDRASAPEPLPWRPLSTAAGRSVMAGEVPSSLTPPQWTARGQKDQPHLGLVYGDVRQQRVVPSEGIFPPIAAQERQWGREEHNPQTVSTALEHSYQEEKEIEGENNFYTGHTSAVGNRGSVTNWRRCWRH